MKTEMMEPMEMVGMNDGRINPFHQDAFLMGTSLGKNVLIMHENFPDDECQYLCVINTRTGVRMRIVFEGAEVKT